jgi:hypothetical protein
LIGQKKSCANGRSEKITVQKVTHIFKKWLIVALVTSAFCCLVYAAVQQSLRQGANDPQIQMAEDIASQMENGGTTASVMSANPVNLGHSLATFVILFNNQGTQIASSAQLHGQNPQLPGGVLDYVRQHGEDRLTWQPEPGVRIAAVVTGFSGANPGFVLVGRSLREVERRIDQITLFCGVTWLLTLGLAVIILTASEFLFAG